MQIVGIDMPDVVVDGLVSAVISGGVALVVGMGKLRAAEKELKLSAERLQREFRLEFQAEKVIETLLTYPDKWKLRSFEVIKHHIGGFDDTELRKLLVRAGAARWKSKNGTELWGLVSRNRNKLGLMQLDADPE